MLLLDMVKKQVSFCSIGSKNKEFNTQKSRLMRLKKDYSWGGVKTQRYKEPDGSWSDVLRRVLVGEAGERTRFHLRYFEIAPGGYTTFESHRHEHVVIGVRGQGICRLSEKRYKISPLDVLYISPKEPHQLKNPYTEPFGFFCIVDAKRDRPKIIKQNAKD